MVADDGRGALDHGARDVGVQIEREDDGDVRPEDLAGAAEHMALDVVGAFGRLRAVHGQQEAFRLSGRGQMGAEIVHQPLEIRAQEPIRRDGPGGADRSDLLAGLRQRFR